MYDWSSQLVQRAGSGLVRDRERRRETEESLRLGQRDSEREQREAESPGLRVSDSEGQRRRPGLRLGEAA